MRNSQAGAEEGKHLAHHRESSARAIAARYGRAHHIALDVAIDASVWNSVSGLQKLGGITPCDATGTPHALDGNIDRMMSEHETIDPRSTDDFFDVLALQSNTLLRMAAAMVGPDDAEDVVQEAVTRAWRAWPSLRDPGAANAWLLRIVGNVCRTWRQGPFGARQRLLLPLDSEIDEHGVGAAYGVDDDRAFRAPHDDPGSSDHAARLDLRQALSALDDDQRLIITMRYYVGLDATEIGHALNTPPATIRTRLRRALALMREQLAPPLPSAPASGARDPSVQPPTRTSSPTPLRAAGNPIVTSEQKGSSDV